MTTQQLLDAWEASIDKLAVNLQVQNVSDVNFDSVYATALQRVKKSESVTLCEKLAKGEPDVLEAKAALLEAQRLVNAGKAKIDFLEAALNSERLKERITARV
jgi:hypothetical protein